MGDRAQLVLLFGGNTSPLYLYRHWGGEYALPDLRSTLRDMLRDARGNWERPGELARDLIHDWNNERVSPHATYPDHEDLVLDLERGTVYASGRETNTPLVRLKEELTFEEFATLAPDEAQRRLGWE